MKKALKRIITFVLCFSIAITALSVVALTQSEKNSLQNDIANLKEQASDIQAEINKLKTEKADQAAILAAIRKKIANTQAQIDRCNQEINSINTKIADNNKAIAEKESEIEADKTAFKKRIRALYMSNSESNIQILLGAEDFSNFLQLMQLTSSISAHDKRLMDDPAMAGTHSRFTAGGSDTSHYVQDADFSFDKCFGWYTKDSKSEQLKAALSPYFDVMNAGGNYFELQPKGCSKATGIDMVRAALGADKEDVYVFGDSPNDESMFDAFENSVCMGDCGEPYLFDRVKYVTAGADEDGLMQAMRHFDLI